MRRGSNGRAVALVCMVAALGAGACQPQLTLVLVRADDLAATPPYVKLLIREIAETQADVFGPFEVHSFPDEQLAPVPPGSPFYVDVIGCQTGAAAECEQATSYVARGCSGVITLERDSAVELEIQVHSAAEGATICPPDPP
ncbi:MAG: hypothetical protein HYS27_27935 [Deltaproteobacteria bacterium]|nr:hypothetical protein [Deltaproteobacteria bacterium]